MFRILSNHFKILILVLVLITISVATSATERLTSVLIFPLRVSGVRLSHSQNVEIRNYLGTRLTIEGVYMAMPESQIKKDLGDAKLESYRECYEDVCRIELGAALFADKSLSVDVVAERKRCRVTASIYNIKQEVPESAADVVTGCAYEDIKVAMISVAAQLSGKMVQSMQLEPSIGYQNTLPAPPELGASSFVSTAADNLPTVKVETGYLSVDGSPKGARVDISGPTGFGDNGKGKVATVLPVRQVLVPAGNYTVKVSWTDYDSEERAVRVYADATETVKVELMKSTGELKLSGKPEGAKSRLECQKGFVKEFGLPGSPFTLTVPRGECSLTVERDGYEKHSSTISVQGGQVSQVRVDLVRRVRVEPAPDPVGGGDPWNVQSAPKIANSSHIVLVIPAQKSNEVPESVASNIEQNLIALMKIDTALKPLLSNQRNNFEARSMGWYGLTGRYADQTFREDVWSSPRKVDSLVMLPRQLQKGNAFHIPQG